MIWEARETASWCCWYLAISVRNVKTATWPVFKTARVRCSCDLGWKSLIVPVSSYSRGSDLSLDAAKHCRAFMTKHVCAWRADARVGVSWFSFNISIYDDNTHDDNTANWKPSMMTVCALFAYSFARIWIVGNNKRFFTSGKWHIEYDTPFHFFFFYAPCPWGRWYGDCTCEHIHLFNANVLCVWNCLLDLRDWIVSVCKTQTHSYTTVYTIKHAFAFTD